MRTVQMTLDDDLVKRSSAFKGRALFRTKGTS
jgi:hypothetical protein